MICQNCHSPNEDASVCSICGAPLRKSDPAKPAASEMPVRHGTVDERLLRAGRPDNMPPAGSAPRPDAPSSHGRRVTVFDPHAAERAVAKGVAGASALGESSPVPRKIVGVLVTYSWKDEGQMFPVLEGRNRIGRDPDQCEVAIPQDETLSAINSHIVFRKNFTIGDSVSMCGTDVDGEPVETPVVPLRNYARIRTGSTHWIFVAIQPAENDSSKVASNDPTRS